jgi:hypothetical protein
VKRFFLGLLQGLLWCSRALLKRVFIDLVRPLLWCSLALVIGSVLVAGGCKLLKSGDRALGVGIWPAEPSLESIDPFERADAARLAAQKYGGRK